MFLTLVKNDVFDVSWGLHRKASDERLKVKGGDIVLNGRPVSELLSVTCRIGSHSVTCQLTQVNVPHLNSSQIGWYSIYLSWRDGRLSWP